MSEKNILLVDDEESICDSLQYQLTKEHYSVDTARSGKEALGKLSNVSGYDLLITDLMLDELNGIHVIKKARENNPKVPVLIITGYGDYPLFNESLELNPCGYLLKPFSMEELLSKVSFCLHSTT